MILVTGAAGKTGKALIKALTAKGAKVRGLVRRQEHAAEIEALGATTAVGTFEDARTLAVAARDIDAVYHICPNASRDEIRFARNVAAAAKLNGVNRLVFHSVLHPQIQRMPHHSAKMRAEELLLSGGFDLTILQPTAYMQNILGVWRGIADDGVFCVPYPAETRLSLVDLDDVAEAGAHVLLTDGHAGATYELVGTAPLSQTEVTEALSASLSKPVRVGPETAEEWRTRAAANGMPVYERDTLFAMFRYYAQYGLAGNGNTLRWLLGREPTTLPQFLNRITVKSAA
jgi:NAD(P)H dehydrogenase (quinone)